MTDPTTTPIIVDPDPTLATLGVAIRYAITTLGGYLVGKGWIDGDLVQVVASIALALLPAVYAAWKARENKAVLTTVAASAPDTVAIVKG